MAGNSFVGTHGGVGTRSHQAAHRPRCHSDSPASSPALDLARHRRRHSRGSGWLVHAATARAGRADDADRYRVPLTAIRRSQRDRLRRRAAQGVDLVESHGPPRMARRCGGLARQGRRRHRAHRRSRRRCPGAERRGIGARRTCQCRASRGRGTERAGRIPAQRRPGREELHFQVRARQRESATRPRQGARQQRAGEPECRARERAQRAGLSRLHADPRALRWCDPVEERQRRRWSRWPT